MDASVNRIKPSRDELTLLVAVKLPSDGIRTIEDSLEELKLLAATAGAAVVDSVLLKREKLVPGTLLGRGQLENILAVVNEKSIKLIVFDLNNVKPAQIRNLEEYFKCRVIGRTEVILDIFAQRARSSEAKIQVELAQLKYVLPRLKGLGGALSRLGGGIGTRGPGEKMLEVDRRHILKRINKLNGKLEKISGHRSLVRKSRANEVLGAVVGYTNAGKSTLINHLAKDDLFVEDRLFATLDAYTRIVHLDIHRKVLLTDTIGFIRNLPVNLINSFRTTLDEIIEAAFLIHVIDITARDVESNIATVNTELQALQCNEKPVILFFNKTDKLTENDPPGRISNNYPDAIAGSVKNGEGIEFLKDRISAMYDRLTVYSRN